MRERVTSPEENAQFFFKKEDQNKRKAAKEYLSAFLKGPFYTPDHYENALNPQNKIHLGSDEFVKESSSKFHKGKI